MIRPDAANTRAEFAVALTGLRESAGLSVRQLARRVDAPPGTLGDYFSGRHIPSASQLPMLRAVLEECGVLDEDEVQRWFAAVARARASSDRRLAQVAAPYPGLRHFDVGDAAVFYGRGELTAAILQRIDQLAREPGDSEGLLAVLGPSGSGKSSVLRAGILAALRAESERGGRGVTLVTPSTHDAAAFAAALTPDPQSTDGRPPVLVVDQLEELFTSLDAAQRVDVLDALAARAPGTVVVLGLRADFYAAAAREPVLFPALAHAPVLVPPLGAGELHAAIVEPARRRGMTLEPGLAELICSELAPRGRSAFAHDSGTLPLLSHALLATWDRAVHGRLTVAAYRNAGGIAGAVQLSAEECWTQLSERQRKIAHGLFLRLLHVDENAAAARRRVSRTEFDAADADSAAVLDEFVQARLLTVDESSVQISHEALLRAWPRLQDWLDTDRSGQLLQRQLTAAANSWDSGGRDDADLLRGVRLADAQAWADAPEHDGRLNAREQDFLRAGAAAARAEQRQARRRSRRQRSLLAAIVVLAVVASGLVAYALRARSDEASQRRAAALVSMQVASRQVADQAQMVAKFDPALAEQLALEAYRIDGTSAARAELILASGRAPVTRVVGVPGYTPLAVSTPPTATAGATPARALIAVAHANDGSVHLYATRRGASPATLGVISGAVSSDRVRALALSADDRLLAIAGTAATASIYDVANPARPVLTARFATGLGGAVSTAALDADGTRLVLGGPGGLGLWSVSAQGHVTRTSGPSGSAAVTSARAIAFSQDNRELAVGDADGMLRVWRLGYAVDPAATSQAFVPPVAGPLVVKVGQGPVDAVAFAPTGHRVATGTAAGVLAEWAIVDADRLTSVHVIRDPARGRVTTLAYSPDGGQLVVGAANGVVQQWNVASWIQAPSMPNPDVVDGVGYTADGMVVSTAEDGTLRIWPRATPSLLADGPVTAADFDATGDKLLVMTGGTHLGVRLWNVGDATRPTAASPFVADTADDGQVSAVAALRPDAGVAAVGAGNGTVRLWDFGMPGAPHPIGPAWPAVGGAVQSMNFSPNGRLLAVGGAETTTAIWDVSDPTRPVQLATVDAGGAALDVRFSPDGQLLAVASSSGAVQRWEMRDPRRPRALTPLTDLGGPVWGVAFSPNSAMLATTASDRHTRLFDLRSPGRPRQVALLPNGPTSYPSRPSFSADGRELAVPSAQHAVWVYGVTGPTYPLLAVLRQTDQTADVAQFAPHGSVLVGAGAYPITSLWNVQVDQYEKALCAVIGTPITRTEWAPNVVGLPYKPPCS